MFMERVVLLGYAYSRCGKHQSKAAAERIPLNRVLRRSGLATGGKILYLWWNSQAWRAGRVRLAAVDVMGRTRVSRHLDGWHKGKKRTGFPGGGCSR